MDPLERKIRRTTQHIIGGATVLESYAKLIASGIAPSESAQALILSGRFIHQERVEDIEMIELSVSDLCSSRFISTPRLFGAIFFQKWSAQYAHLLDGCVVEKLPMAAAIYLQVTHEHVPVGARLWMGMTPVSIPGKGVQIFNWQRGIDGTLRLDAPIVSANKTWPPETLLLLRIRKVNLSEGGFRFL